MNTKKKALKALLILAVVLLICMFFAKTVQTITTAKVQRIQATRGKLEDRIELKGDIFFSQGEDYVISDAAKLNIVVDKVMVKLGYLIKAGDTLFTAIIPSFDDEVAKIRENYEKKVRELTVEYAAHLRLTQESPHNRAYQEMLAATDAYYLRLYDARAAAIAADYALPEDVLTWGSAPQAESAEEGKSLSRDEGKASAAPEEPAASSEPEAPESTEAPAATPSPQQALEQERQEILQSAMQAAYEARVRMDETTLALRNIYAGIGTVRRTGDGIFDYIKKMDGLREEVDKLMEQMLDLDRLKQKLVVIRAERDGWLTGFSLKKDDKYDGSKAAYTLSLPGEMPVLRSDITDVKKPLAKGMKVQLAGSNTDLMISDVQIGADSKKYALIELDEATLSALGGLSKLIAAPQDLTITYKAARTTTLIPASALRTGGDNSYYIYVVRQNWGGMLSNSTYTVQKQNVTVLETSNKLAALEDDLSYVEIADREDRALEDGQAVMDYVD